MYIVPLEVFISSTFIKGKLKIEILIIRDKLKFLQICDAIICHPLIIM